jgi:hypothetical protein
VISVRGIALSRDMFDAAEFLGICDKFVSGSLSRRRPLGSLEAGRAL